MAAPMRLTQAQQVVDNKLQPLMFDIVVGRPFQLTDHVCGFCTTDRSLMAPYFPQTTAGPVRYSSPNCFVRISS